MNNFFIEAKSGGKNHGLYKALHSQTKEQLLKSLSGYQKNIEEQRNKIKKPAACIDNWEARSEQYKRRLLKKWEKDMLRNHEQLLITLGVITERRINNE